VIVGRDAVAGQLVAKLARERGAADALWRPADMTVEEDVAVMVKDTVAAFGQIDVLVNNVEGNAAVTPFASSTPQHWRADLEINLMSMFYGTHAVLPYMLAQGSGGSSTSARQQDSSETGSWRSTRRRRAGCTRSREC
jgi:2-hydroxycyclohexanecarboxyl-CoA dehydrogenase